MDLAADVAGAALPSDLLSSFAGAVCALSPSSSLSISTSITPASLPPLALRPNQNLSTIMVALILGACICLCVCMVCVNVCMWVGVGVYTRARVIYVCVYVCVLIPAVVAAAELLLLLLLVFFLALALGVLIQAQVCAFGGALRYDDKWASVQLWALLKTLGFKWEHVLVNKHMDLSGSMCWS